MMIYCTYDVVFSMIVYAMYVTYNNSTNAFFVKVILENITP